MGESLVARIRDSDQSNLGAISHGAHADLLVVEGDTLSDVKVMTDPQKNLKIIMKDGVIYKDEPRFVAAIARVVGLRTS